MPSRRGGRARAGQVVAIVVDRKSGAPSVDSQPGGRRRFILRGFVRDVWSIVPPVRSIVRVLVRSSGRR